MEDVKQGEAKMNRWIWWWSCPGRGGARRAGMMGASKSRALFVVWALAFCGMLGFAMSAEGSGNPSQDVVATVNGKGVLRIDVDREFSRLLPWASYHGSLSPEKVKQIRDQALEKSIVQELLAQAAEASGITVKPSVVRDAVEDARKRSESAGGFKAALESAGFSEKEYGEWMKRGLLAEAYRKQEVQDKAIVSDEELRRHYEDNKASYVRPEAVQVREIQIGIDPSGTRTEHAEARKRAEQLLDRIRAGEDFGALAYKYSSDRWAMKQGDLGLVHRGRLDPELEKAAFSLEPGRVSEVLETYRGFHILKVERKVAPTQLTFEEIKGKLKQDLEKKRREELDAALVERLRKSAAIVLLKAGEK